MSKRLLLIVTIVVTALLIGLTLYFKNHSTTSEQHPSPAFALYINAYTSGIISSESTIRIMLTNEIEKMSEFGKTIDIPLFDFSPS
ncbi:MAG TPA: hypothetical protein VLB84_17275, partial [Bacteroidia bacterium]|nr:hypothetical protein [Bacteroidia bacterium]